MTTSNTSFSRGIWISFCYCIPALIAITICLIGYYDRTIKVEVHIEEMRDLVALAWEESMTKDESLKNMSLAAELNVNANIIYAKKEGSAQATQLIDHFIHEYTNKELNGHNKSLTDQYIRAVLDKVWLINSLMIASLALLPFLLLGTRLGFSNTINLNYEEKLSVVRRNWWMKLAIGGLIAYGWVYVLNPIGRGAGTIEQFLTIADLSRGDTLPIYIKQNAIVPVIAGFLGWYLYSLSYFFSKTLSNDVVSTQVYSVLFQKFLFTYGLTYIIPSLYPGNETEANLLAFLIGYFPMSAFSLLKDAGMKFMKGPETETGQLSELPGISRWQILRLEEEGIDSIGALAQSSSSNNISHELPAMEGLVVYWTDIAQLYSILGQENYQKVKKYCYTASEFIIKAEDAEFIQALEADGICSASEVARKLHQTFPKLPSRQILIAQTA